MTDSLPRYAIKTRSRPSAIVVAHDRATVASIQVKASASVSVSTDSVTVVDVLAQRHPLVASVTVPGLPGRQGEKGERGETGPSGGVTAFLHRQIEPALLWIVNHNLGLQPAITTIVSVGGAVIVADVIHISDNQLQALFVVPTAGLLRCV